MSQWIVKTIYNNLATTDFASFLGSETILIPTPKSSLMQRDTLWVPHWIAKALVNFGLGKEVLSCLVRHTLVQKAAQSPTYKRPTLINHYKTLGVKTGFFPPNEILLIDDIVTHGSTLLEAANRLADALPNTSFRAFAAIRTISNPDKFYKI